MYLRTYFDKDNTIVYKSNYNFGNMQTVDLFYGGDDQNPYFSRYIFHFDTSVLEQMYQNCQLGNLTNVRHKLRFKHMGFTPTAFQCMPSSYNVCLFRVPKPWIEGCGVSENCDSFCTNFAKLGCVVSKAPSNWYYSVSGVTWDVPGIYDSLYQTPEYLMCTSVDCNSGDLELDVSSIVNAFILTGSTQNYGFGLAFHYDVERNPIGVENHVVFASRETPTFFEPFLETKFVNPIEDDRAKFYLDKTNKLYLFATADGEPVTLGHTPVVKIYDETDHLQFTLSGSCQDTGVYYVNFSIPSASIQKCYAWTDKWTNLYVDGKNLPDVSLKFNILPAENYYGFGYDTPTPETSYSIGFRGIQREERIRQGGKRKIYVDVKSPNNPKKAIAVNEMYYRIYIREGEFDELTIMDWMPMNIGVCENWFYLDTSWMLPQTYLLDFKIVSRGTVRTYENKIKFTIIDKTQYY